MKKTLILASLFFSFSIPAFAGEPAFGEPKPFSSLIWIRDVYNPGTADLDQLRQECVAAEAMIRERIETVSRDRSIPLESLTVTNHITFTRPDPMESTFTCYVSVQGESSQKIGFMPFGKQKNHLKRKGYSRAEFPKACADIEETLGANPNEIFQKTYLGYTFFNGNYCAVRSIVIVGT